MSKEGKPGKVFLLICFPGWFISVEFSVYLTTDYYRTRQETWVVLMWLLVSFALTYYAIAMLLQLCNNNVGIMRRNRQSKSIVWIVQPNKITKFSRLLSLVDNFYFYETAIG